MSITSSRAFDLLPAIIRERDRERGGPLAALFDVLAREGSVVEDDLARMYDNLFIETCDEWVVPYLGDLLGVDGLNDTGSSRFSNRARVANTLGHRRRKGTASMLEQLAQDTTGWSARVVEYFELLGTTQWMNHVRMYSLQTPDLRRGDTLERIGTAFEETRHFVDVRRISRERGRYNLPNVGVFLWRLDSQPLAHRATQPFASSSAAQGRFFVDPLGIDASMFNRPQTEASISSIAQEINVPGVLRLRPLDAELDAMRVAIANGRAKVASWFGRAPAFSVSYRMSSSDSLTDVKPEEILIGDLSEPVGALPGEWLRPPTSLPYTRSSDGATVDMPIVLAIDPTRGRIVFPDGIAPAEVRVTSSRGFPGDVGGGSYDRRAVVANWQLDSSTLWHAGVGRDLIANPAKRLFNTFEDAVAAWNSEPAGKVGLITLVDNGSYAHLGVTIELKQGSQLFITSADWPELPDEDGAPKRTAGRISPIGTWALLLGTITVRGESDSQLWMDGLLIEGDVVLQNAGGTGLNRFRMTHSTIVPERGMLQVENGHDSTRVELCRSICGAIQVTGALRGVCIEQSAVDGTVDGIGSPALQATDAPAEINGSTMIGDVRVQQLEASNSIFTSPVRVERRQTGCVRFSFVSRGSATPRRYRCQPDLALESVSTIAAESAVLARMVPDFTDEKYGRPAYLQLTRSTPEEIRTGAADGAEMGVWWYLRQPQREANLRASLDEYLRLGLEAGLIFVT